MEETFWICVTSQGNSYNEKYNTEAKAKSEAEKIARQNNCKVYVMVSTDCVKVASVIWEKTELMPF